MTTTMSAAEQSARRFLAIAGTLGVIGIAFNLDGDGTLPKLLAAAGIITLIWSLHRYGRLGADAPLVFEAEAPRKKKKKKRKPVPTESESNDGM